MTPVDNDSKIKVFLPGLNSPSQIAGSLQRMEVEEKKHGGRVPNALFPRFVASLKRLLRRN